MAKTNTKSKSTKTTHMGSPAESLGAEALLRRSVCACLLWEDTFYEDGKSVADRIASYIPKVAPEKVASLAIEAREDFKLRHVPLLLTREMARYPEHKKLVSGTLNRIIQRPDELSEFLSIYWKEGRTPVSSQAKKGLARAFTKFDGYSLAKYNTKRTINLRDVLFLCHAKPINKEQELLWKQLIDGTLEPPDTWEVSLSSGQSKKTNAEKKDSWTRLLLEDKLGALALLRNLRNMEQVGVDSSLIREGLNKMKVGRVLPFRFITASKHAMHFEPELEDAMMRSVRDIPKLPGKTIVVVDVSGSMYGGRVSAKSELDRAEAACAVAMLARELCENPRIYATAGNDGTRIHKTAEVPARRGFALKDAIYQMCQPLGGGGIFLTPVTKWIKEKEKTCDRMIVITDEQDCAGSDGDNAPSKAQPFGKHNYILNVNTYDRGISFGKWTNISGFSEALLKYIYVSEQEQEKPQGAI